MSKVDRGKAIGRRSKSQIIGWRETVSLPDLTIGEIVAKIDTGARTSALHAVDVKEEVRNGVEYVSFHVPHLGEGREIRHSARISDKRAIKNTSGIPHMRYIVETEIIFGERSWKIELSLADRDPMKHDLILGRTAIRRRNMLVDAGKSFLLGKPKKKF